MAQFLDSTSVDPTEILASEHGTTSVQSITIASGAGTLAKGTIIGRYTSGVNSGFYGAYDNDNSDGTEKAVGILKDKVVATSSSVVAPMYDHGTFYISKLTGFDTDCQNDLTNCVFVYE